jgi:hypothetical protein
MLLLLLLLLLGCAAQPPLLLLLLVVVVVGIASTLSTSSRTVWRGRRVRHHASCKLWVQPWALLLLLLLGEG